MISLRHRHPKHSFQVQRLYLLPIHLNVESLIIKKRKENYTVLIRPDFTAAVFQPENVSGQILINAIQFALGNSSQQRLGQAFGYTHRNRSGSIRVTEIQKSVVPTAGLLHPAIHIRNGGLLAIEQQISMFAAL